MRYKLNFDTCVLVLTDGGELIRTCTQFDTEYLGWVSRGNTVEPVEPRLPLSPTENIAAIKAKAGEIIITRLPDYKQRNYLARKAELQDILIAGGILSKGEQAEWDFLTAEWAWAKSIRAASNEAEAAGTQVAEIVWPI